MCVPRSANDAKCPSSQRPAGQTIFQAPDATIMAPFLVGDYITFSGINDGNQILAYSIVADSVQITTTGVPTYIRVEDAIIGTFDNQDPAEVAPADSRVCCFLVDLELIRTRADSHLVHRLSIGFYSKGCHQQNGSRPLHGCRH